MLPRVFNEARRQTEEIAQKKQLNGKRKSYRSTMGRRPGLGIPISAGSLAIYHEEDSQCQAIWIDVRQCPAQL